MCTDVIKVIERMIAVIDYKAGNLTSVVKALKFVGAETLVTQDPAVVAKAEKIVLPGVGHFQATELLKQLKLTEAIREAIDRGKNFLGICVGLQWLYEGSTEAPETDGLCAFSKQCERFPATYNGAELKSPHVGWNSLENIRPDSRLLRGVDKGSFVYFTHSWRAPVSADTAATTPYGGDFTSAVERGNVMGVQFHPEKSSQRRACRCCKTINLFVESAKKCCTKSIIACLDVRAGRVVKGIQFVDIIDAGDPAELAHRHAAAGADEIVLLDITATHEGRGTLIDTVQRTARTFFVPFTVGGGIRSADDAAAVFDAGADKVSINSSAVARPELIGEIGGSFGAQAVIVAIDARRDKNSKDPVRDAEVFVSGGRTPTGRKVLDWAREAEDRGAGEILLTSMDTDGMRNGFDCALTAMVSEAVQIPVIAIRRRRHGAALRRRLFSLCKRRQSRRSACRQHLSLRCNGLARAQRRTAARGYIRAPALLRKIYVDTLH